MAERLKAPVLKTGGAHVTSVGSNPTLSANRGCSTMVRAPAFQAGDAGSIPVTRSKKYSEV